MNDQLLQVLREIDKLDKIGLDGVCAMLGNGLRDASGAFNKGVGLMPIQVGMIRLFLTATADRQMNNDETLNRIRDVAHRLENIRSRIDLMSVLEEAVQSDGTTAWDALIALPTTNNETWSDTPCLMRPANIAWALDDILYAAKITRQNIKT